MTNNGRLELIATVASSYLRRNAVTVDQIETVIANVKRALDTAAEEETPGVRGAPSTRVPAQSAPAVPINKSVERDHLVCLEDGLHVRTLKRHLKAAHGLTPDQYRNKWDLPDDYPLTAPAYSARRSKMAKSIGLGRKGGRKRSVKTARKRRRS